MNIGNNKEFESFINGNEIVLVDFWAEWCGPCRVVGPIMDELINDETIDFKVAKVDVDFAGEIATKFGVRNIPTVLRFENGKPTERLVGANSKDAYIKLAKGSN